MGKTGKGPHLSLLLSALAAIGLFRIFYILHGPTDLCPDEAHYWEWSRRLDISYYSKGPMIAWLIRSGTSLLGDTELGVRFPAVLLSFLGSVLLYRLAAHLDTGTKPLAAFASGLLPQFIPLFSAGGVIFTIDSPFLFSWILSLYFFWKAVNPPWNWNDWIFLGISMGLGFLSKYTMLFFCPCGFLFLLLTDRRSLLRSPKPYAACLIGLAISSPVILWNARHDWVTVRHVAVQAHLAEGWNVSARTFLEFAGSQAGVITPILFVMMLYSLVFPREPQHGRHSRALRGDLPSSFLFWFSIPVLAFFALKSIHGSVQANWAAPGYVTGIVALSRKYFVEKIDGSAGRKVRITRAVLRTGISLAALVTAASHFPWVLRLPPSLDPTSRLRGWDQMGKEVSRIYASLAPENEVLIFSDSYQVAGELAFYAAGHPVTYCVNLGRRTNQYDLWPDMNDALRKVRRRGVSGEVHGIFVTGGDREMPAEVGRAFDRCERRRFRVYERGRPLREHSLFLCYGFMGLETARPATY